MALRVPDGDDHVRAICEDCPAVVYANPKVVVSCVILAPTSTSTSTEAGRAAKTDASTTTSTTTTTQVLLAKRAIEPRAGYWGIPQGYMELNETTRQAICREVREETGADIMEAQLRFRALYNVPGSVQLVYSVTVAEGVGSIRLASSTTESSAIGFFPLDALPALCFPTVQWALDHCSSAAPEIQQKNKLYDVASGEWSESEDRDVPLE